MKTLLFSLFLSLLIAINVRAEELTSLDSIKDMGLKIRMGELTGAGSKISLSSLEGLILPGGALMKNDITGIILKNLNDPKLSDIVKVKRDKEEIAASEFIGFITP